MPEPRRSKPIPPLPWPREWMTTGECALHLGVPKQLVEVLCVLRGVPRRRLQFAKMLDRPAQALLRDAYVRYRDDQKALHRRRRSSPVAEAGWLTSSGLAASLGSAGAPVALIIVEALCVCHGIDRVQVCGSKYFDLGAREKFTSALADYRRRQSASEAGPHSAARRPIAEAR